DRSRHFHHFGCRRGREHSWLDQLWQESRLRRWTDDRRSPCYVHMPTEMAMWDWQFAVAICESVFARRGVFRSHAVGARNERSCEAVLRKARIQGRSKNSEDS